MFPKMQGGWGSERGGPRDWGSNPLSPLKTLPPSPLDQTRWTFVQLLTLEGTRSFLNQK